MPRTVTIAGVLLLGCLLYPAPVDACTCITGVPICQALWRSDADLSPIVFEGTVASIEPGPDVVIDASLGVTIPQLKVTFRDVKPWVGHATDAVMTGLNAEACGYQFQPGRRYVVDATKSSATGGAFGTGRCSHTRPIEEAAGLLAYLRSLSDAPLGGVVYGQALMGSGQFARGSAAESPVSGVRMRLWGPVERNAVTGADGSYRFDRLPVGDYAVAFELPDRPDLTAQRTTPYPVRIENARGCAVADFSFSVNGIIAGSLVDEAGTPISNTILELREDPPTDGEPPRYLTQPTDSLGRFEFAGLPPGRYVLGINLQQGPALGRQWAPTRSGVVELGRAERRTLPPFATRWLERVSARGIVLDAAGKPIAGQSVTVHPQADSGWMSVALRTTTAADGTFEVELLDGQTYAFSALANGRRGWSPPVVAGRDTPRVKLSIP